MKIHIITIFPESFSSYFWSSIIKKAIDSNLVEFKYYKLALKNWGNGKSWIAIGELELQGYKSN